MQLTNEQKAIVTGWVAKGEGLSEIQRKLISEFNITLTFMDVRFLVDDLGVKLKDKDVPRAKTPDLSTATPPEAGPEADLPDEEADMEDTQPASPDGLLTNVKVDIDLVTKPGTVVSGNVVFSDGVKASWALDTYGRLALGASKAGYKPGQADIQAFQKELGVLLKQKGF
ncbi:MAG: hypothetical protein WCN95_03620 [bacterium]